MRRMITLYAEFTVKPGNEEEVAQMMAGLAENVRAEPGNVAFEPYVERDNPRRYFVYEVYADDQAFADHIGAPYGAVFNNRLNEIIEESGSQLTFLTRPGGGDD